MNDREIYDLQDQILNSLTDCEARIKTYLHGLKASSIGHNLGKHFIMIHHSLTDDSETLSWQAIRRYHKETNKWKDVGYHFGIEMVGKEAEVLVGRPIQSRGAHCIEKEMNEHALGICFVGNYDKDRPPAELWRKGVDLVTGLCLALNVPPANVIGHGQIATYKTCPGALFDLETFRRDVTRDILKVTMLGGGTE